MEQQTAVNWLIEQLVKNNLLKVDVHPNNILFSHARKMETEQAKQTYLRGIKNYDPTFKGENQG